MAQLAARLGAEGQTDKVGRYYHQMEQGLLPASGVSDSVLEALGRIVGYGADALRKAGEMPGGGRPGGGGRRRLRAELAPTCGGADDVGGGRRRARANGTRSTASSADAIERQLGARRPTSTQ